MMEIWNENKLTDEDIKSCQGDYYGCEICQHHERCAIMKIEKLIAIMEKEDKTSVS